MTTIMSFPGEVRGNRMRNKKVRRETKKARCEKEGWKEREKKEIGRAHV